MSAFHRRQSIDRDIDTLLEEIFVLAERVRVLRGHRNQLAPISRIPPDVLLSIFRLSMPEEGKRLFPSSHNFSHVCQYWRYLAVDSPLLWSNVPRNTHELTAMFLERSQRIPLTFCVKNDKHVEDAAINIALDHMDRTQTLYHRASTNKIGDYVDRLSRPAPSLVQCTIIWTSYGRKVPLPDTFLGLYAPRLRNLHLCGLDLPWRALCQPGLVRSLTSLTLRISSSSLSVRDVIATLRATPALENLVMEKLWYQEARTAPMDDVNMIADVDVELCSLTTLKIREEANRLCSYLPFTRVPPTTSVSIELFGDSCDLTPLKDFLEGLNPAQEPVRCLAYTKGTSPLDGSLVIELHADPISVGGPSQIEEYKDSITDEDHPCLLRVAVPVTWRSAGHPILGAMRLAAVGCLDVSLKEDDAMFSRHLLEHCTNATELLLVGVLTCEVILPTLVPQAESNMVRLLPDLRRMRIHLHWRDLPEMVMTDLKAVLADRNGVSAPELQLSINRDVESTIYASLSQAAGRPGLVISEY